MRILITGGAGCLGSNLIEYWLPQGHQFMVLDNFVTGKREVVPEVTGFEVREGHIASTDFVGKAFADFKPEVVIHSAASYKDPENWHEDALINVQGTIEVVRASEKVEVARLINFQTVLCYGKSGVSPIPVDHTVAPFTSYGISKTCGEQYLLQARVPAVSLRLANVTGPRLAIGPIPTFYKRLEAGQKRFCSDTARDFLDMSDFYSMMDLAVRPGAATGVFNVASGEAHNIKEFFELVAKHLKLVPGDVPVTPPAADDVPVVALDSSKTTREFGRKPLVGFEETILRQLAWYDKFGVTDVFSHLKAAN